MHTLLRGRDLISDLDFTVEEANTVLDVAFDLKRKRAIGEPHALLRDKTLALLFFFQSTRTRCSFEAGMAQLGGHAAFIDSKTTQIGHGDTPKEIGEILGRYFDGIAIRECDWGTGNNFICEVADAARVPVISMQCEYYHPCQTFADILTMMERKGRNLRNRKVAITWAYASSYQKPMSVPISLSLQLPRFGIDVTLAHPPEFSLPSEIVGQANDLANKYNSSFKIVDNMEGACEDADVIYVKSWGPFVNTTNPDEAAKIISKYKNWLVDENKIAMGKDDVIFMHPLPVDRNVEVTDGVIDGPHSAAYDQAENRMHVQKAIMALTMN